MAAKQAADPEPPLVIVSEFRNASEVMRNAKGLRLSSEQKLTVYALFKQAENGTCTSQRPGFFDMVGRAKWDAWMKLGAMTQEEAMQKYIDLVTTLLPDWHSRVPCDGASQRGSNGEGEGRGGGSGGGGPAVSILARSEADLSDEAKTLFDWCKEGNVSKVDTFIDGHDVNARDENGMSLLHWACDRGHRDVAELLINNRADINCQDEERQTPLHYATSCGHAPVVQLLLSSGASTTVKDLDGHTPADVIAEDTIARLFDAYKNT